MSSGYESIFLDPSRCIGCTTCIQRCPTEAIRVRDGKAVIWQERCVDCGECIRVCPRHAMKARVDSLDGALRLRPYMIALPAPALYGQFGSVTRREQILAGLRQMGFADTFEVAAAAEALSAVTHSVLATNDIPHPVITTACPVILRIVRMRFPSLLPHLLNYRSPMEVAARWSKRLAARRTGLPPEDIGCVFISPCPAKCTSAKSPLGSERSSLDGIVSIAEVAPRLLQAMKELPDSAAAAQPVQAGALGVGWSITGGQAAAAMEPNNLAASGMENIIRILEALEDDKLKNVDLIELNACLPGCVGGVLTVENPYIAKARMEQLMRGIGPVLPSDECPLHDMKWEKVPMPNSILRLDSDIGAAMEKMEQIRLLQAGLCGIDCGACGSPTCRAFAEDIVTGRTTPDRCVFAERDKLRAEARQEAPQSASER